MSRRNKQAAVARNEQPKPSTVAKTPQLIWAIILISIVVTIVTELRIAGRGDTWLSVIVAYTAFVLNIACSALGLQTPQRFWWAGNLFVGVLTMTFIGAPTIPSALWTAARVLIGRLTA